MLRALGYLHCVKRASTENGITWWGIAEVCDYLNMNEDQIGRLTRVHGLPHRDFGGIRRYPKELVEEWAETDIVCGSRAPRARRRDAGRPTTTRTTGRQLTLNRASSGRHLGIAAMPG
jgi:excisionase family DNA binding protein